MDEFAYVASHDLRAPLRAIYSLAQWIAEDAGEGLSPESQEHLAKLRHRVERMEKLLSDLLAYSPSQSHRRRGHNCRAGAGWLDRVYGERQRWRDRSRFHTRIFEIFTTLKPRNEVEGSGMGLAVVKKLVESRDGAIQVTSAINEGASFRFTWPISLIAEAARG